MIHFRSGVFGTYGATAEFGDAGTLVHLTNKQTSALGAVAGAVSGAGAQVQESLEQAAKISTALPGDPKRRALQDQVDEKESRLAWRRRTGRS
ncbi:hypothetical protein OM076_13605 [Solirubrobacter ginsenosidimutans]|uniref:Uncharacterized protein n=1 Tax=Solirubrobacter ginsenosidimutans TaxID=490573 RepID=A0A9X3S566_9ACTN|nr:hypothetical protein [Solirubrobacter ginsenosidimutans]MDA0161308.1 hypothetical protein [Solirubrobacter ginsenosidimutans]